MTPRFTPRQLEAFIAAAELHSFRQAAGRIHLTPSAISNLIAELEGAVGFALFDRTTRKIALTPAGRSFLPAALAVQRQIGRAAAAADDIRDNREDVVRVAAPLVVASTLLPRLIAALSADSRFTIRVIDTPVVWLADRVAIGEADLAIGPDRDVPANIVQTRLFPTPWVFWCRPDHALAKSASLTWRELADIELFAAGRDHEERIWPQLVELDPACVPRRVQVVDHISTSLGMAAAGLGATFSPDYVAPLARSFGLVQRPLTDPDIMRHLSLYERVGGESAAVATVRDYIVDTAKQTAAALRAWPAPGGDEPWRKAD
ncbi:MAG: LysR family transcriptional regulator [Candidatus Sphingomonas phytovorans]|nr:LysR family transcriptional regulator [Sphingomonas sp.]WEK02342.1 MAG: LysR family transcriptional regulator [Sphingomonas sp.]